MKAILSIVAALAVGTAAAVAQSVDEQVAERLAAPDALCMKGEQCAAAAAGGADTAAAGNGARSGEQVYNGACQTCHAAGVAGAPKIGDAGAWSDRVAKGMDTLYSNAINGIRAMPAKGLCADCSNEEIQNAVDYMVENSQ